MTTTLASPAPSTGDPTESRSNRRATSETSTRPWRRTLQDALAGDLVLLAFMLAVSVALQGRFDPFPIVVGVVVGAALFGVRRGSGRPTVVAGAIPCALLLVMVFAFGGLAVFARPQSTFDLILMGGLLVVNVLGLAAAAGALRGRASVVAALAPRLAGAAVALLVVVGVVAGLTAYSASPMAGDLRLEARQYEFDHSRLEARAGRLAVFVQNDDPAHHDFTIKGVVSTALPGEKARRAVFTVGPGTYRYYCTIHPDAMEGTLVVTR